MSPAHDLLHCCTRCGACYRSDFEHCPLDGGRVEDVEHDPLIGATLGHYVIEALIGIGAMGRVYRAHHAHLPNRRYAVKVLFGELAASPVARARFAHEAEAAGRLQHANIVGVHDVGNSESGLPYLVMELVEGTTLGALVDYGALSPQRTISFARQLCEGLEHAHAHGVVHRDFKPDNILVAGEDGSETLRITDFGLATSTAEHDARLTTSVVMCTPAYAAPEQMLGQPTDQRADLYALGVTMYAMLTGGALPFGNRSYEVLAWKITAEWPAVATRGPRVPQPLAALVRRLLARDPAARPASARAVIRELDKLDTTRPPARQWWRPHWVATTCFVFLAALGVGRFAGRSANAGNVETIDARPVNEPLPCDIELNAGLSRYEPPPPACSESARRLWWIRSGNPARAL